jgi:hypothetical protein
MSAPTDDGSRWICPSCARLRPSNVLCECRVEQAELLAQVLHLQRQARRWALVRPRPWWRLPDAVRERYMDMAGEALLNLEAAGWRLRMDVDGAHHWRESGDTPDMFEARPASVPWYARRPEPIDLQALRAHLDTDAFEVTLPGPDQAGARRESWYAQARESFGSDVADPWSTPPEGQSRVGDR